MSNGKPWGKFDSPLGLPPEELLLKEPSVEDQLQADWKAVKDPGCDDVPRMSAKQLKEFIFGVIDRSIFTSNDVRDIKDIPMVFLPLSFGCLKDFSPEKLQLIGGLYAPMSSAFPRSVNGYPMFGEVRIAHRNDWARAWKEIQREASRRSELKLEENE